MAIENFAMAAKYPSGQIVSQVCISFFLILFFYLHFLMVYLFLFKSRTQIQVTLLLLQDLFSSGVIKSATDFQVYQEVAGLSGLDFAYTDNTAVYHTKVFFAVIMF